jgi:molybdate transport system permease protein
VRTGLRAGRGLWTALPTVAAAVLVALLVVPLVALGISTGVGDVIAGLGHPLAVAALGLSLFTTACSLGLVLLLGTPLAWLLARRSGRLSRAVATLVQLPIVIPPAVSGLALLLAFGRRGLLGPWLESAGIGLPFTTAAVVLAELFVSAPFYVQAAAAAFRRLDPALLLVARSLGAGPARTFFRVALPLSLPGLTTGAALSWSRALGEFGATLMFAGNLTGRTQTLPLAIYTAMETDLRAAKAMSLVLVVVAFGLLLLVGRRAQGFLGGDGARGAA